MWVLTALFRSCANALTIEPLDLGANRQDARKLRGRQVATRPLAAAMNDAFSRGDQASAPTVEIRRAAPTIRPGGRKPLDPILRIGEIEMGRPTPGRLAIGCAVCDGDMFERCARD